MYSHTLVLFLDLTPVGVYGMSPWLTMCASIRCGFRRQAFCFVLVLFLCGFWRPDIIQHWRSCTSVCSRRLAERVQLFACKIWACSVYNLWHDVSFSVVRSKFTIPVYLVFSVLPRDVRIAIFLHSSDNWVNSYLDVSVYKAQRGGGGWVGQNKRGCL